MRYKFRKFEEKTPSSCLVPWVRNPQKIQENSLLGIYPGTKSHFLGLKNFLKLFWLHLVPGTTIEKIKKNTGSA
jgi:hypothetical protein